MNIGKKGVQALFMQKAWAGAFLGHDQDGKWRKIEQDYVCSYEGCRCERRPPIHKAASAQEM